jgi:hypothetical protein
MSSIRAWTLYYIVLASIWHIRLAKIIEYSDWPNIVWRDLSTAVSVGAHDSLLSDSNMTSLLLRTVRDVIDWWLGLNLVFLDDDGWSKDFRLSVTFEDLQSTDCCSLHTNPPRSCEDLSRNTTLFFYYKPDLIYFHFVNQLKYYTQLFGQAGL